jgi:hypothetical protein
LSAGWRRHGWNTENRERSNPGNRDSGKPERKYSEAFERQKFKLGLSGNLAGRPKTKPITDKIKKIPDEFAKEKRLRVFEPV